MKAKILYIEDNQDNLRLVKRLLTMNDYMFVGEQDAFEGIKRAELELPDLILMDINLPGLSGYEATARIHSIPSLRTVPIVAVTAGAMAGDRERALSVGCVGYITKPIDVDNFVPSVAAFISGDREKVSPDVKTRFLEEHNLRLIEQLESKIRELESSRDHLEEEVNKRTEELVDIHQKVLEMEKNNVVSEMSGAIAHELNQPLSILIGYCELLESGQVCHGDTDNITGMLLEQADRMAILVKKLALVTEYRTKQYSRGKIINMDEVDLTESGETKLEALAVEAGENMPLLFMYKNQVAALEEKLKDYEGCALAGHMLKASFHRLNNYFQAIRGYTDLMLSFQEQGQGQPENPYLPKLSGAVDGSIELMTVFTELLSSYPDGRVTQTADLEVICVKLVSLIQHLYRKQDVSYTPPLPFQRGMFIVPCERSRLIRLVLSFLVMTVHRLSVCRKSELSVTLAIENAMAKITIEDCCGVSFIEFEEREKRGIDRQIVQAPIDTTILLKSRDLRKSLSELGGHLETSHQDDCSRTHLFFPLSGDVPEVVSENTAHATTSTVELVSGSKTILVVDDEVSICYIMKRHLEAAFTDTVVDVCHSAEDALSLMAHKVYNLVLLDINLPGKSGLDILPALRKSWPETVIIIITGLISDDDLQLAYDYGVFSCLRKPVKKNRLVEIVSSAGMAGPGTEHNNGAMNETE